MAWRPQQGAQQYPPRAPGGVTAQQAQATGGVNLQQYSQLLGALSSQSGSQGQVRAPNHYLLEFSLPRVVSSFFLC